VRTEDAILNETQLRQAIRVLEEENALLAERAEESLLLGAISETFLHVDNELEVFELALERISILKTIPFTACCRIDRNVLEPISSYCAFSDRDDNGFPMTLGPDMTGDLFRGGAVVEIPGGLNCNFRGDIFDPKQAVLVPFKTQSIEHGVFLFVDDTNRGGRLPQMQPLLVQLVNMAVSRFDNIYLLRELARANKELECRVEERTADLVETNRKLSQSHETFLRVLDSVDATIYVVDLETREILFMNRGMIDRDGKDLTGQTCYSALRNRETPCDSCTVPRLLDADGNPAGTITWQEEDPETGKCYVCNDRAIRWVDGRLVRIQIATDITQLREMELQLLHSQKMEAIGTLAGGIAHDFNNLMMGIQGQAELLEKALAPDSPHLEKVQSIRNCTHSASDLTRQLLGMARGGKYEVVPVDINALLQASSAMFGRTRHDIVVSADLCEPPPVSLVDRTQIEQVLLNLFVNAGYAMPDGGKLILKTSVETLSEAVCAPHEVEPGWYVKIRVEDTGTGMDEETRQRVFDPFFTTKETGHGTGLGLASAYGIIKNHAGIITLQSKPGEGTVFDVYLPLSDQSVPQEKVPEDEPGDGGGSLILLVDDEEIILKVTRYMLEDLGFEVAVAQTGHDAVSLVQQQPGIRLVILDMIMPGQDGGSTFERIREVRPELPVILSSGYSLNGKAAAIMERGCNGFIQKPFELSELAEKIHSVL